MQGTLTTLPADAGGRVSLPLIPEGGSRLVRMWVTSRQPGRLAIGLMLHCPAPVTHSLEIEFEEPFDYKWVSAPPVCVLGPAPRWCVVACGTAAVQHMVLVALLHRMPSAAPRVFGVGNRGYPAI